MTDRINNQACALHSRLAIAMLISVCCVLGSCKQAVRWEEPASSPPPQTTKSTKKRSSRGNPAFYEVFGKRYYVLKSSYGFKERGVASWYGKKFHGRPTSSGVIYDMHKMTAAHKTLPLPTTVRVRNLKNGRSVIVQVNDRGPFVDNRIIDMSFAAATRLDMIKDGTALVEITVLSDSASLPDSKTAAPSITSLQPAAGPATVSLYLQVGAFGDRANAQQLRDRLHGRGFQNVMIRSDTTRVPPLFRVRLGPITNVTEYDQLVEKMTALQIVETHLVTESGEAPGS